MAMTTKKARKTLQFKAVTIYLSEEQHQWLKDHAEKLERERNQPYKMAGLVRDIVQDHIAKIERK
jgi:hypothetical protein